MSKVAVKFIHDGVIRRSKFEQEKTYENLVQIVLKLFPELPNDGIVFSYTDEDGDLITLSTDGDLSAAFEVAKAQKWTTLKFNIILSETENEKTLMESSEEKDFAKSSSSSNNNTSLPVQKPDLNLLSSSMIEGVTGSFTIIEAPNMKVKTTLPDNDEDGNAIPVAAEVNEKEETAVAVAVSSTSIPAKTEEPPVATTAPKTKITTTEPVNDAKQSNSKPPKNSLKTIVPLRATSGGALIYKDGTVEFGMGGEAVLLPDGQTVSCILSYKGFPSVAASDLVLAHGKWYYEVTLLTSGLMQIGWCNSKFTGSANTGDGVGDDKHSFAFDGFRQLLWSCGKAKRWGLKWKAGDIVCCAVDIDSGVIQYALNGDWNTGADNVAFRGVNLHEQGLIPAVSFQKGEKFCMNFGQTPFSYAPPAQDFASVHSAYGTVFNRSSDFVPPGGRGVPGNGVPGNVAEETPSATEQLAALLLKDDVRDAISRFLGHPTVATCIQHVMVATLSNPESLGLIIRSQIEVVTPIFLQLVSEQPSLIGLLPNIMKLITTLMDECLPMPNGPQTNASPSKPKCPRGGGGGWGKHCGQNRGWPENRGRHGRPSWGGPPGSHFGWGRHCPHPWGGGPQFGKGQGRRGGKWRRHEKLEKGKCPMVGKHEESKCPVKNVGKMFSSLLRETGDRVTNWASQMCPESASEKQFKTDLQKAIDMSVSDGAKKPSPKPSPTVPHPLPVKDFDKFPAAEQPVCPFARGADKKPAVCPFAQGMDKKQLESDKKQQPEMASRNSFENDLEKAIALSVEENILNQKASKPEPSKKLSVFGANADDLFDKMFDNTDLTEKDEKVAASTSTPPSQTKTEAKPRAKFIEQNSFDVETGDAVDLLKLQPGQRIAHTWTLLNPASKLWPKGVYGTTVGGDANIIQTNVWATPSPVGANTPVHITVEAQAPTEPGRYISYFRLFDSTKKAFGDRIWLDITVSGSSSDTDWDMLHGGNSN